MLIRLTPDKISAHWPDIKSTLQYNLLPIAEAGADEMNSLLEQMLVGTMQTWVITQDKDIVAMAITMFSTEVGTDTKNLLIYSVYGYSFIKPESWKDALVTLRKFAQETDCNKIIAYSRVERVITIAKECGANVDYRLIELIV